MSETLVASGSSWLFLVVPGCLWLRLVVSACFWLFMVVSGCLWLFLVLSGCSLLFLVVSIQFALSRVSFFLGPLLPNRHRTTGNLFQDLGALFEPEERHRHIDRMQNKSQRTGRLCYTSVTGSIFYPI